MVRYSPIGPLETSRHDPPPPHARRRRVDGPDPACSARRTGQAAVRRADRQGFLLPNGWTLSPAGDQVNLTDLPLNVVPLADGRHVLVATDGYNSHDLSLVDLTEKKVVASETVRQSWFGLAADRDGSRVWWSGGGSDLIHEFRVEGSKLTAPATRSPNPPRRRNPRRKPRANPARTRTSGAAWHSPATAPCCTRSTSTPARSPRSPSAAGSRQTAKVGNRPYDVAVARNGSRLYVSDWAGRAVLAVDPADLRVVAKIAVGEHPNQIALHPKDDRLFVACASSNSVAAIDTKRGVVTETIMTAPVPAGPEGSTPDALAVAPDGETLYVANADNNCVAVIDVSTPNRSQVKGYVPTGWYPTAVAVTPDGKSLLVGVGKGNQSKANPYREGRPGGPRPSRGTPPTGRKYPYIGTTLSGALSIIPVPDDRRLAAYTETVYKNCPYSDKLLDGPLRGKDRDPDEGGRPLADQACHLHHQGEPHLRPGLRRHPEGQRRPVARAVRPKVSPNHHKLAEEFVLLDNLYCNGHVSADGHPWSTMAYNTDHIARNWALTYSAATACKTTTTATWRRPLRATSGTPAPQQSDLPQLWRVRPPREPARRHFKMEGSVPGLVGHFCPDWGVPAGRAGPSATPTASRPS